MPSHKAMFPNFARENIYSSVQRCGRYSVDDKFRNELGASLAVVTISAIRLGSTAPLLRPLVYTRRRIAEGRNGAVWVEEAVDRCLRYQFPGEAYTGASASLKARRHLKVFVTM